MGNTVDDSLKDSLLFTGGKAGYLNCSGCNDRARIWPALSVNYVSCKNCKDLDKTPVNKVTDAINTALFQQALHPHAPIIRFKIPEELSSITTRLEHNLIRYKRKLRDLKLESPKAHNKNTAYYEEKIDKIQEKIDAIQYQCANFPINPIRACLDYLKIFKHPDMMERVPVSELQKIYFFLLRDVRILNGQVISVETIWDQPAPSLCVGQRRIKDR